MPTAFAMSRQVRVRAVDWEATGSTAVTAVAPAAAIGGVAAASGGYFPTTWGWAAIGIGWALILLLLFTGRRLRNLELAWIAATLALAAWTWLSVAWAASPDAPIAEGERVLVYLAAVPAVLLLVRRPRLTTFAVGLLVGALLPCAYGLATRLAPDRLGGFTADSGYRLFEPLGYWNALGIFAALAVLLAWGLAAFAESTAVRELGALAPAVLVPTIYFTFSRGSWLALGFGLAVVLAASPRRLRLASTALVLAPLPAIEVWLCSRTPALTTNGASLADAARAGHHLAVDLGLLALAQLVVAGLFAVVGTDFRAPRHVRSSFGWALLALAVVAAAGAIAAAGGPVAVAHRGYGAFVAPSPPGGSNLNSRLFSLSGTGRIDQWRAAWGEFRAHPLLGGGAGSYARWWNAHRPSDAAVQDAHNLYLETLGELGAVGLVLLVALLALPLVAFPRARRHPLAAPALGAYAAFLVHADAEWDWEVPAVTLLALGCGAIVVVAARPRGAPVRPLGTLPRAAFALAGAGIVVVAFLGLLGNRALGRSQDALLADQPSRAESAAASARRWMPWSSQPLQALGEAELLLRRKPQGIAQLRQAAAKDPGNFAVWLDLAAVTHGSEQQAALARAERLDPRAPELVDFRATLLPRKGKG